MTKFWCRECGKEFNMGEIGEELGYENICLGCDEELKEDWENRPEKLMPLKDLI
jgi:hypothetical protein